MRLENGMRFDRCIGLQDRDGMDGRVFDADVLTCHDRPLSAGDEISVGTSIHIEHRAASGIGARVKAVAVVDGFDGRFYTVRVSATDGAHEIGRGTVGRAFVSVARFTADLKKN